MRIIDWSSDVCSSDLRDRQAIAAKFLAHRMSGVVDLLADAIAGAADKRGRCKGVASNAELALEFAALEHRAPRGVDKAGAGRTHHSSSATSSIRSRRSALRTSRQWREARQPVKAASAISAAKTISVAASGPTRGASTMIAPNATASNAKIGRASCRVTVGQYV